jgi:uncharacterized protein YidB (DUF937 family)
MGIMDLLGGLLKKKESASSPSSAGSMPDLGESLGTGAGGLGSLVKEVGGGSALITALMPMLMGGGLSGILGKLQGGGHANQVASWVGPGANEPIGADDLEKTLGPEQVAQIAEQAGVTPNEAKTGLAALIPGIVDHLSPNGSLPGGTGLDGALGQLKGLLG